MAKKIEQATKNEEQAPQEVVVEQLSRAEQFIEDNKKMLGYVLGGIALLVLGYWGYKNYVLAPKSKEAQEQMFRAVRYFEKDSFERAINGDAGYPGLEEIVDSYWGTPAANLARYYLGVSYLRLGRYDEAIEQLKKYDGEDELTGAMALGCTGDAYAQLEEWDKALKYYGKAAAHSKNEYTAPIYLHRQGLVAEKLGKYDKAISVFETLQKEYPNSQYGRDAEKYLGRALGAKASK